MKKIKKVGLAFKDTEKGRELLSSVKDALLRKGFEVVEAEEQPDLMISLGGDGTFLKMVKDHHFANDTLYVGINGGTLGFSAEAELDDVEEFLEEIRAGHFKVEEIGIQETVVETKTKRETHYSLNEIVIREAHLNTLKMQILIDDALLERFIGDGILVATSFGSTAYNLSFGGSIVDNTFHTLQITPIAPLNNKSYRNLLNSIVLKDTKKISLIPEQKEVILTVDGDNYSYQDVVKIESRIAKKKIFLLRRNSFNFTLKVNEKFLK